MNNYLNGFNRKDVSINVKDTVSEGDVLTFYSDSIMTIPPVGANFCGVCREIRDGVASVTFCGHVTVKYSGTAPGYGYNFLSSDGNGAVAIDKTTGRLVVVTAVDTENSTCDILL